MVEGCRGGERFEGWTPQGTIPPDVSPRPTGRWSVEKSIDTRNRKRGEPQGWLQGATNLQAVQGPGLRTGPLRRKPLKPGGTARTERVRNVAVPDRSLGDGSGGSGRRDGRVGGEVIDEPHERSPTVGLGLRAESDGMDRANRYASEEEVCRGLDPMRRTYDGMAKANDPSRTRYERRRALAPVRAVKSLSSSGTPTSGWRGDL
jgi:hypothetical protein